MSTPNVKEVVRDKYGQAALRVTSGASNPCCRSDPSTAEACCDPITSNLYDAVQEGEVPDTAIKASLGCGNPTALAELKAGDEAWKVDRSQSTSAARLGFPRHQPSLTPIESRGV